MLLCSIVRSLLSALRDSFIPPQPEPGGSHSDLKPQPGKKLRVAVLGGGAAGVSAAFWLTHPGFQHRFDVTLYQMGWRLGGKCASGRDMATHDRIEEHGLHMLMGCYQHAFFAIRKCYDEWQPRPGSPIKIFDDAFTKVSQVMLLENDSDPLRWDPWPLGRPLNSEHPGDQEPDSLWPKVPTLCDFVSPFTGLLKSSILAYSDEKKLDKTFKIDIDFVNNAFDAVYAAIHAEVSSPEAYELAYQAMNLLHEAIKEAFVPPAGETLSQDERRTLILLELGAAMLKGILHDVCLPGSTGVDGLDEQEFRSWLGGHQTSPKSLDSAPMRVLYDLMFAYNDGDAGRVPGLPRLHNGNVAAGVALQFVFEAVVGYKGALLWRMNAGMGDTIFMPFYHVLKARKAKIKLFHRVTDIALTPDRSRVGTITIDRQAESVNQEYWPFEVVRGLDCWPNQPRWTELKGGALLSKGRGLESSDDTTRVGAPLTLNVGQEFDLVVLALPPEVIKRVAPGLVSDAQWKAALDNSKSVVTEAFQLWLKDPIETYGGSRDVIGSAFEPTFSSWADMSHLIARENWNIPAPPRALAYFCGCIRASNVGLTDPAADADRWMQHHLSDLWSGVQPGNTINPNTVTARYERANEDPSERYVQTPAGSVKDRLNPNDRYFGNLYVAGDWTKTRFSGGCVESAFESGLRVAGAISTQYAAATSSPARKRQ